MEEILPQDPVALLKAVSSMLPPEVAEQVRQTLAARAARYINRGVVVTGPSAIDDVDPTNEANARLMHEQPGTLFEYGINASSFGGFTPDKSKFVIIAGDLVQQRRRQILEIILHDLLGNRPAVELVEGLEDYALIAGLGLYLFAGNKLQPKPLGEKNAQRLVDYIEEISNNPENWTCEYWRFADVRARQVAHWLPTEPQP